MSASFYIHVINEELAPFVRLWFNKEYSSSEGEGYFYDEYLVNDKWIKFEELKESDEVKDIRQVKIDLTEEKIGLIEHETPNIFIGDVSWLKASLFDDADSFIPATVQAINDLILDNLPVIDDEFIKKVEEAFVLPNNTIKKDGVWNGKGYAINNSEDVINFLLEHKGKKCFTISW